MAIVHKKTGKLQNEENKRDPREVHEDDKYEVNDIIKNIKRYRNNIKQYDPKNVYHKNYENFNITKKTPIRAASNSKSHSKNCSFVEKNKAVSNGIKQNYTKKRYQSSIRGQEYSGENLINTNYPSYGSQIYLGDSNSISDKLSLCNQKLPNEFELNTSQYPETYNSKNYLLNSFGSKQNGYPNDRSSNGNKQALIIGEYCQEKETTKSSDKTITKGSLKVNKSKPHGWVINNIPSLAQIDNVLDKAENQSVEDMHYYFVAFQQKCKNLLKNNEGKKVNKKGVNTEIIPVDDNEDD